MLREDPVREKKKKDYSHPTRWQLFWRVQGECLRRSVTPMLMYMFMSMLMLTCSLVKPLWLQIVLGVLCIIGGAFFNAHLCYQLGKMHYGAYVAGELHRKNELYGIASGGDHRPEREYRFWKGILIGFYVSVPVLFFGILAGCIPPTGSGTGDYALLAYAMFAGYGILPITWFGTKEGGASGLAVSPFWSLLFALIPILVSTAFYIVGAWREQVRREREAARMEEVAAIADKSKKKK